MVRRTSRYTLDEGAFDSDPQSEPALYFAGLMMSDGCISRRRHGQMYFALSLQERDRPVLDALRAFLKTDRPLYERPRDRRNPSGRLTVQIPSDRLCDSLRRYGVTERKSLTASAAEWVRPSRHFWRGVVDGNGTLALTNQSRRPGRPRPQLQLVGAPDLVSQFARFARGVTDTRVQLYRVRSCRATVRFGLSFNHACRVAAALYSDTALALPRKMATARIMAERLNSASDSDRQNEISG